MHSDPFFAKTDFRRVEGCIYDDHDRVLVPSMANRPVILTGFNFTKTALAALSERYEIAGHMDKPTPAHIPPGAAERVQAIVSTGSVGASDALMAALPRLSLICCYGTGYERIDLEAARRRNVMVTHGADANAP